MSDMPSHVTIKEVGPREGFQFEKGEISLAEKISLVDALSDTGVGTIEFTSFVSPKWVPQMADADQMVAGIKSLGHAVEVIRCHHERWDGKGYPSGLAGEAIPLGARIFAVADAFDAMTSDRPYRQALPFERACQEIADGAGSQFDPAVVATFAAIAPDLPDLHASLHATSSLG